MPIFVTLFEGTVSFHKSMAKHFLALQEKNQAFVLELLIEKWA